MHHIVVIIIIVNTAMLTLCYSIMSRATLIFFCQASMLTLHNSSLSRALWLPQAWYYEVWNIHSIMCGPHCNTSMIHVNDLAITGWHTKKEPLRDTCCNITTHGDRHSNQHDTSIFTATINQIYDIVIWTKRLQISSNDDHHVKFLLNTWITITLTCLGGPKW